MNLVTCPTTTTLSPPLLHTSPALTLSFHAWNHWVNFLWPPTPQSSLQSPLQKAAPHLFNPFPPYPLMLLMAQTNCITQFPQHTLSLPICKEKNPHNIRVYCQIQNKIFPNLKFCSYMS